MGKIILVLLAILAFPVSYFSIHHLRKTPFKIVETDTINIDVQKQLHFIKLKIATGEVDKMQAYYPEGAVFTYSLYALARLDLCKRFAPSSLRFSEAMVEVDSVLIWLNRPKVKTQFSSNTQIENGAFYTGWNNYVLAKKMEMLPKEKRNPVEVNKLKYACSQIAKALNSSKTGYFDSYPGAQWPADVAVCVAVLALYNKSIEPIFENEVRNWLQKVSESLDDNGFIPHSVKPENGKFIEQAKGSSQALILNFLFEIDAQFGKENYKRFKTHFLIHRFALPAFAENNNGKSDKSDIDSGPVFWGVGSAASMVGARAAFLYGDQKLGISIRNSLNAVAIAKTTDIDKSYLFGKWLMADAFMAWLNSVEKPN